MLILELHELSISIYSIKNQVNQFFGTQFHFQTYTFLFQYGPQA